MQDFSKTESAVEGGSTFPRRVAVKDAPTGFIGRLRNSDGGKLYDGCLVMKLYSGEFVSLDAGHDSSGIGATWDKTAANHYMIEELPKDSVVKLLPKY